LTDVSEKHTASNFKVKEQAKQIARKTADFIFRRPWPFSGNLVALFFDPEGGSAYSLESDPNNLTEVTSE
jgi:hypothetical protein